MTVALETINLVKRFSGIVASNNVSLRIEKGARHALIGPNGAGKTTLINLLTGVQRPTSGRILLDGEDISDLSTHERVRLGIVRTFQINQLFNDLTPLETIGLAVSERRGQGLDWWRIVGSRPDLVTEVVEILERFHLTDVIDKRTAVLPYGKQRLLEIARRDRLPSARAAARRAGGRRSRGRAARNSGRRRGTAQAMSPCC